LISAIPTVDVNNQVVISTFEWRR